MNVLLPILLFGMLVFIHELGHFTIAKLSGVFVERFALGFGPAIFRKKWGETEYAICLLPLGGYVKMRGEELEEGEEQPKEDPRSFANQPVWTRIAIVAMGPISNLILPIAVFTILFMLGMNIPMAKVGSIVPGYPAQQAGIRPGDKVLAIDDQPISTWNELTRALGKKSGQETKLKIERDGETKLIAVTPTSEPSLNSYGEKEDIGKIGVDPVPTLPVIGISNSNSKAAKLGIKTGDLITKVNGEPVSFWWQIDKALENQDQNTLELTRMNGEEETKLNIELPLKTNDLAKIGIEDGTLYIRSVLEGSVAEKMGIQAGDKVLSVNGEPTTYWLAFHRQIQNSEGKPIDIELLRDGKKVSINIQPEQVTHNHAITHEKMKQFQLGVISCIVPGDPALFKEQHLNPFKALYRGVEETVDITVMTVVGLGKLVTGKLSVNTLGGPISIFYIAGSSYKMGGWEAFFRMMAILSVTLAVLNFLPIPVLDGGHLFFFLIEAIKGSPVHLKIQRVGQQIGMVLILSLMVLTFYVDINRFFVDKIRSLFQ
ncbi:MAG: RIP metalloprotease RseP [Bdellovibrionales bacterium]|nr:RIP metalloprotease RseP [Bdellovibrionales bacterium]